MPPSSTGDETADATAPVEAVGPDPAVGAASVDASPVDSEIGGPAPLEIDEIEPELQNPWVGGTPIEAHDWTIDREENLERLDNIVFGDFRSDGGYVPSQPDDTISMRVTLQEGSNYGTDARFLLPPETREAWISYCLRFASTWTTSTSGKLPGFAGDASPENGGQGGAPATGANAWSARGLFGPYDPETNRIPLGQYVYHAEQSEISEYGDPDWWGAGPENRIEEAVGAEHDRWHAVRQHVLMNSPGSADGLIEAWLDDVLVYRRADLHFTDNPDFRVIHRFWLDVYHGGSATSPSEQHVYFDRFNYSVGPQPATFAECGR